MVGYNYGAPWPHAWYPNAYGYAPGPSAQWYPPGPPWNLHQYYGQPPVPVMQRSPLYKAPKSMFPDINKYLAADTTLIKYDVRREPLQDINTGYYFGIMQRGAGAQKPLTTLHLVSRDFPWRITVEGTEQLPITCGAVWQALHDELQKDIEDGEWGILNATDEEKAAELLANATKRYKSDEVQLKRIDWLGKNTVFVGCEKVEGFVQARCLPGGNDQNETWVVKMASR